MITCSAAATAVAAGKLIAYPTEAIYGLGCNPLDESAVEQLLQLKIRDRNKGLILVAHEWQQLERFVSVDDDAMLEKAQQSWPGPVTWVMPASLKCSALLTGGRDTVAVRVSSHEVVRELCKTCGHALVSTSANISGQMPFKDATEVETEFGDHIAGVVEGELGGLHNATSIFDIRTGVQLR